MDPPRRHQRGEAVKQLQRRQQRRAAPPDRAAASNTPSMTTQWK
jgi:hypothetical protein